MQQSVTDATFLALQSALAGEYSLERELGRGGMGIVYLAREVVLDRLVAIKALPAEMTTCNDIRDRFLRGARTAASLSHPNIVPIHRVGEADGIPYFVMTFVGGETLGERLRSRGPIGPTSLTRILRDVALALGYAHGRGVIHRDVKPDNILIEEGSERSMVTDFGVARIAADSDEEGRVMGTAHFMSPEQAMGEPLDGRSDIYALGVLGFISASGRLPFPDGSLLEYAAARANQPAPAIATVASGVPASVCAVLDRRLQRMPADRFATADEIATALDAATAPAKARLPVALRVWASRETPLIGLYQISSFVSGSLAVIVAYSRLAGHIAPAFPFRSSSAGRCCRSSPYRRFNCARHVGRWPAGITSPISASRYAPGSPSGEKSSHSKPADRSRCGRGFSGGRSSSHWSSRFPSRSGSSWRASRTGSIGFLR